jgi:hypothetical protein
VEHFRATVFLQGTLFQRSSHKNFFPERNCNAKVFEVGINLRSGNGNDAAFISSVGGRDPVEGRQLKYHDRKQLHVGWNRFPHVCQWRRR